MDSPGNHRMTTMIKRTPFIKRRTDILCFRVPLFDARDPTHFALQAQAVNRYPLGCAILPDIDTDHKPSPHIPAFDTL